MQQSKRAVFGCIWLASKIGLSNRVLENAILSRNKRIESILLDEESDCSLPSESCLHDEFPRVAISIFKIAFHLLSSDSILLFCKPQNEAERAAKFALNSRLAPVSLQFCVNGATLFGRSCSRSKLEAESRVCELETENWKVLNLRSSLFQVQIRESFFDCSTFRLFLLWTRFICFCLRSALPFFAPKSRRSWHSQPRFMLWEAICACAQLQTRQSRSVKRKLLRNESSESERKQAKRLQLRQKLARKRASRHWRVVRAIDA